MLPQIKRILYATDLTKNSSYAFYFAADLARTHGAKIIILHCVGKISPGAYRAPGATYEPMPPISQDAKDREAQENIVEIKRRLEEFSRKVESQFGSPSASLVSETIVKSGHAVEEIFNATNEKGCDLIVLGTHGKGWLQGTSLGSVARSVLERTRKPVFVIP